MTLTAKITSKGQLTIPRAARLALNCTTVEVEIKDGTVILRPVKSVAGALQNYAREKENFADVRAKVWREVADEKAGDTT